MRTEGTEFTSGCFAPFHTLDSALELIPQFGTEYPHMYFVRTSLFCADVHTYPRLTPSTATCHSLGLSPRLPRYRTNGQQQHLTGRRRHCRAVWAAMAFPGETALHCGRGPPCLPPPQAAFSPPACGPRVRRARRARRAAEPELRADGGAGPQPQRVRSSRGQSPLPPSL